MVFIDDEAIRSLVAQEMLWSGNYVAPTMHGDTYLNKPPLWNWILAISFYLHGEASEWLAALIKKDTARLVQSDMTLLQMYAYRASSLRPQRTTALLATFAPQMNGRRSV